MNIHGDPGEVSRDGSKKPCAKSGPVRVYKLAYLLTLAGPYFACDLFVTSRPTAPWVSWDGGWVAKWGTNN